MDPASISISDVRIGRKHVDDAITAHADLRGGAPALCLAAPAGLGSIQRLRFTPRLMDWAEQRIALKYNEDWPNLPPSAFEGPGRNMSLGGDDFFGRAEVYQPLVKTYEAVVEDWQNAKRFAPLKVRVPNNVPWGKIGEAIREPVVAASKDVQIVVTNEEDLGDYVLQKPGVEFYRVTSDGIDLCKWRIGDEGRVLVQEKLGDADESLSARTKRTLPLRYYEWLGENRKNGDITIPIWPDCRMSAEEEAAVAEQLFRVENAESE